MDGLERIFDSAAQRRARVVLPELDDPRIAAAADRMRAEGLCEPVGLGDVTEAQLAALVEARGMKEPIARRMLSRPLYRAAAMVGGG